MTTNRKIDAPRDEVLYAFDQTCPRPSAADIIEWCSRYPEFADDIREFAAVSRDISARDGDAEEVVDTRLLNRAFSQVLNLIYEAEHAPASTEHAESFQQLMQNIQMDVPSLAREMDIERSVLADLVGGRICPPVGARFGLALTRLLSVAQSKVDAAIEIALRGGGAVHAKSKCAPTSKARSYADVIRSSSMPDERKRYWLDED